MKNPVMTIAKNDDELSSEFCNYFSGIVNKAAARLGFATVALSGGKTPDVIFRKLAADYLNSVDWSKLIVFWTDERCVPPDNPQSNFGRAYEIFLRHVGIPDQNIFRIHGESVPETEAERYSQILMANLRPYKSLPCFDLVMLGIGEDGHTASIFPGQEELFNTEALAAVSFNPADSQTRITITGRVINNASNISVLASGANKKKIVSDILEDNKSFPISLVNPYHGNLTWFLTTDAVPDNLPGNK